MQRPQFSLQIAIDEIRVLNGLGEGLEKATGLRSRLGEFGALGAKMRGGTVGTVGLESHHIVFWSTLHRMDFGFEMDKMRWALLATVRQKGQCPCVSGAGSEKAEEEKKKRVC